jgi:hypothetical protein
MCTPFIHYLKIILSKTRRQKTQCTYTAEIHKTLPSLDRLRSRWDDNIKIVLNIEDRRMLTGIIYSKLRNSGKAYFLEKVV